MSLLLVELSCNWRTINNLRTSKKEMLPEPAVLKAKGVPICEALNSIIIAWPTRPEVDMVEMRDWTAENVKKKVRLFNRFQYDEGLYRTEKVYIGTNFRFECGDDAFLFKLFWA